ncbi:Hypothetical protein D9617_8g051100 [Elsinoe fawcettii]|nr:Hypothetical protein D9617_8g051100 [Elsinoe fawcettii]
MFTAASSMLTLPREIILIILKHVNPLREVRHDERGYLSRDSLVEDRLVPSQMNPIQDLGNFRLTCKRHAELGAVELFQTFTVRFTSVSLGRLRSLAGRPALARLVRKLVYKVPFFYHEGTQGIHALETDLDIDPSKVRKWLDRYREQRQIVGESQDKQALSSAAKAFEKLEQVLILQVLVQEDHDAFKLFRLQQYLPAQYMDLAWGPACSRATTTLISALQSSRSGFSHLSSYFFSTQAAIDLSRTGLGRLQYDPRTLTRLIVTFYEMDRLNERIEELATSLHRMLSSLVNLENLHFGFYYPLDIPFYTIFPQQTWCNLVVFGVEGWKLSADEITSFTQQHRDTLKGLRLRGILLRDGDLWSDVLLHLRTNLDRLKWISLGRIGYASDFDQMEAHMGFEITEEMLNYNSDEEDSDIGIDNENEAQEVLPIAEEDSSDIGTDSDGTRSEDSDHTADDHENEFPLISSPRSATFSAGTVDGDMDSMEILHDDGSGPIGNSKRKMWERWVLRRTVPF